MDSGVRNFTTCERLLLLEYNLVKVKLTLIFHNAS